jgi:hypothetical protein
MTDDAIAWVVRAAILILLFVLHRAAHRVAERRRRRARGAAAGIASRSGGDESPYERIEPR